MGVENCKPHEEAGELKVSVDNTTLVFPATPTEKQAMFLTSCDLVCRTYPYINRLFFYEGHVDYRAAAESLKKGLERTLVAFFPLAGRFGVGGEDDAARLHVNCNDAGVEFVEAFAQLPFSELLHDGFQHRSLFWELARRTELRRSDFLHLPILSVQMTKFQDGAGMAIGVSLSHAVADAQSFYDFVRCWSDNCRGAAPSLTPKHIRTALSVDALFPASDPLFEATLLYMQKRLNACHIAANKAPPYTEHGELYLSMMVEKKLEETKRALCTFEKQQRESKEHVAAIMEKQQQEEDHRLPRRDLVQKVFSFSAECLQRIKRRANEGKGEGGQLYTTFESFCAHWWQALIRAKDLPEKQQVFLLVPINCRQRFLGLAKSYFGNCLDGALVKAQAGELCGWELKTIAAKIHEAIKEVTEETFLTYIKEVETRKNAIPHFDRTGLFHIVDSPKYAVYDTDFGWGGPSAVRAEGFRFGAEVQILQGRSAGFDLFCALEPSSMSRLQQDPSFLAPLLD